MARSKKSFEIKLSQLARRYIDGRKHYEAQAYNETAVRNEFLNPFLKELGWDVENEHGRLPNDLEVMVETGDCEGRPDYNVRLDGKTIFYFEAKAPHVPVDRPDVVHQAKKYAWSDTVNTVPVSVVSNFESVRVYDASFEPSFDFPELGEVFAIRVEDYLKPENVELLWLLSKESLSTADGLTRLLKLCRDRGKASSEKLQKRPDERLLEILGEYRQRLASAFYSENRTNLDEKSLTDVVGTLINRLLFIRVLEDRETIERRAMKDVVDHWKDFQDSKKGLLTKGLSELFSFINENFNGKLFVDPVFERLKVPEAVIAEVITHLYGKYCPFQFNLLDVNTLGHIYEQFLAERITLKGRGVSIEQKPEVKRAGGVYYTPHQLVAFIVEQTMKPIIADKDPEELVKMTGLDLACGSGTFLLALYDHLMQHTLDYLLKYPKHKLSQDWVIRDGEQARLSFKAKHKLLMSCVFGSDIDAEAVKVSILSLCLKALENESSIRNGKRLLPTLNDNVICADAILESENASVEAESKYPTEHFPRMVGKDGFDVVIGNPPYVTESRNNADLFRVLRASESVGNWYEKNCDYFNYFILQGMKFLKAGGRLGYIVPQYLATRTGCSIPRTEMLKQGSIGFYADFGGFTVFDTAKGHHSCVFVYEHGSKFSRDISGVLVDDATVEGIESRAKSSAARSVDPKNKKSFKKIARQYELELMAAHLAARASDQFVITSIGNKFSVNTPVIGGVVEAIVTRGTTELINPDDISQGLQSYPDKVRDENGVLRGVFILSNEEARELFKSGSDEERELLRSFYWPSDFAAYCGSKKSSTDKVLYITSGMVKDVGSKNCYSRVRKHLKSFAEHITSANKPYGLHRAREERFFSGTHRLVSPRKVPSPSFFYSEKDCFVDEASFVLSFGDRAAAMAALAVFNSSIAHVFLYAMKRQGTQLQIDKEVIESFKVPASFFEEGAIEISKDVPGLRQHKFASWKELFAALGEQLVSEMTSNREASAVSIQRLRAVADVAMREIFGLSKSEFKKVVELVGQLQGDSWCISEVVRAWSEDKVWSDSKNRKGIKSA